MGFHHLHERHHGAPERRAKFVGRLGLPRSADVQQPVDEEVSAVEGDAGSVLHALLLQQLGHREETGRSFHREFERFRDLGRQLRLLLERRVEASCGDELELVGGDVGELAVGVLLGGRTANLNGLLGQLKVLALDPVAKFFAL